MKRVALTRKKLVQKKMELHNKQLRFYNKKKMDEIDEMRSREPKKFITRHEMRTGIKPLNTEVKAQQPAIKSNQYFNIDVSKYDTINKRNISKNIIVYENNYTTSKEIRQSIIISYKESGEDRKINLKKLLNYLSQTLDDNTEIILVEQDENSKLNWLSEIEKHNEINHIFLKNEGIFNKGWGYNIGAKEAKGNCLIFHDSDIFIELNSYCTSLELLNKFDVISPYKSISSLNEKDSDLFIPNKYKFKKNANVKEIPPISGGIFMIKKKNFLKLRGFDEDCFGWGYEDSIFDRKIMKMELSVYSCDNMAVHLYHKNVSEHNDNIYYFFQIRNKNLHDKYLNMTKEELEDKIKNIIF